MGNYKEVKKDIEQALKDLYHSVELETCERIDDSLMEAKFKVTVQFNG